MAQQQDERCQEVTVPEPDRDMPNQTDIRRSSGRCVDPREESHWRSTLQALGHSEETNIYDHCDLIVCLTKIFHLAKAGE